MTKNKFDIIGYVAVFVIAIVSLVLTVANLIGAELPDALVRTAGIVNLICIPVVIYTAVKKSNKKD